MTLKQGLGIFWRTFAALALAALIAVQGLDWAASNAIKDNGIALGLALLLALFGALGAVGYAWARTPAVTAFAKACRAAVEAFAGGVVVIGLNTSADFLALPKVLYGIGVTIVFAFGVTYLGAQPAPAPAPAP